MARHTDKSRAFEPTWAAYKKPVDLDRVDTDTFRVGWPSPTIYREHEVIHILCNVVDKALAVREAFQGDSARLAQLGMDLSIATEGRSLPGETVMETVLRLLADA